jgi:SAM-dependent methyltransferase
MNFDRLAESYTGNAASSYDALREGRPDWIGEQAAAEKLFGFLPRGAVLVDIPVGTGRFLPLYQKHGFKVSGFDISKDMLREAGLKAGLLDFPCQLEKADIRRIPLPTKTADVAICVRFLNWVEFEGLANVLAELERVSRFAIIAGLRVWSEGPSWRNSFDRGRATLRHWLDGQHLHSRSSVETLLTDMGFDILETVSILPQPAKPEYLFLLAVRRGYKLPSKRV